MDKNMTQSGRPASYAACISPRWDGYKVSIGGAGGVDHNECFCMCEFPDGKRY